MRNRNQFTFPILLLTAWILTGCSQTQKEVPIPEITVSSSSTTEADTEMLTTEEPATETVLSTEDTDIENTNTTESDAAESTTVETTTTEPVAETADTSDWVTDLKAAEDAKQLIIVASKGSSAVVSMHNQDDNGVWSEILSASAQIGNNGVGKTKEGDRKTPRGMYHFLFAFGRQENPGCSLSYTKVDDTFYWVDDSNSSYYNKFVSTSSTVPDWSSAENIMAAGSSYNYVLATDYNSNCTPGAGSAIFLHCLPTSGAGCIAVPENSMKQILQNVQPGCILIIDNEEKINQY